LSEMPQHMRALEIANMVRHARHESKVVWKSMKRDEARRAFAELVLASPDWACTWEVRQALLSLPGVGARRVRSALAQAGIPATARIGALTERQRLALAAWARGEKSG
jgi:hypothetical protein